ncbi:MAG: hypothetical protein Q8R79_00170 [Legionellaceae bacterium]|nr:hypothetical protein [Legionellaceae bacterium]
MPELAKVKKQIDEALLDKATEVEQGSLLSDISSGFWMLGSDKDERRKYLSSKIKQVLGDKSSSEHLKVYSMFLQGLLHERGIFSKNSLADYKKAKDFYGKAVEHMKKNNIKFEGVFKGLDVKVERFAMLDELEFEHHLSGFEGKVLEFKKDYDSAVKKYQSKSNETKELKSVFYAAQDAYNKANTVIPPVDKKILEGLHTKMTKLKKSLGESERVCGELLLKCNPSEARLKAARIVSGSLKAAQEAFLKADKADKVAFSTNCLTVLESAAKDPALSKHRGFKALLEKFVQAFQRAGHAITHIGKKKEDKPYEGTFFMKTDTQKKLEKMQQSVNKHGWKPEEPTGSQGGPAQV